MMLWKALLEFFIPWCIKWNRDWGWQFAFALSSHFFVQLYKNYSLFGRLSFNEYRRRIIEKMITHMMCLAMCRNRFVVCCHKFMFLFFNQLVVDSVPNWKLHKYCIVWALHFAVEDHKFQFIGWQTWCR